MPFIFERLDIKDVILIKPKAFSDERGYFLEIYKESFFNEAGIKERFIQDNYSYSKKNVIRGLHYQETPFSQAKLIKVLKGKVLDVAVDIRKDSTSFGKWISVTLSDDDNNMLYIPEGFAHGFVVLSDEAYFLYECTKEYSPLHEKGIRYDDPGLKIEWGAVNPIVSKKDMELPFLKDIII
jgi:dTDP-4-dehydrorhamnose 3,5-epimerase